MTGVKRKCCALLRAWHQPAEPRGLARGEGQHLAALAREPRVPWPRMWLGSPNHARCYPWCYPTTEKAGLADLKTTLSP